MIAKLKPTPRQLEYQDWEFGLFVHFGIRTFYEGHRDWDGKEMDAAAFNPTQLDCEQWISTAKEAGMKYAVLVAKHHDGFANWPSKYTDFSVAASPWKEGKGDVVREFVDACRKYDMKVGLYYSPADASTNKIKRTDKEYDDYFISQISELLTGYGEIDILWFDGCGSENHQYDWKRIIGEIRRMQPNILIFNMGDPDFRWVGNEAGIAPYPCWNVVDSVPFSIQTDRLDRFDDRGYMWLPAECDCMMREHNWFYSDSDEQDVKSLDRLMGMYYYSVGRGANLLLNIGPDRRGLLPDKDRQRLIEFGNEIRRRFSNPLASTSDFAKDGLKWSYNCTKPVLFDHMVIKEDLREGENVRRFRIVVVPYPYGQEISIYEGMNIGHKAICSFPPIKAGKVMLEITEADEEPTISSIELYYAGGKC